MTTCESTIPRGAKVGPVNVLLDETSMMIDVLQDENRVVYSPSVSSSKLLQVGNLMRWWHQGPSLALNCTDTRTNGHAEESQPASPFLNPFLSLISLHMTWLQLRMVCREAGLTVQESSIQSATNNRVTNRRFPLNDLQGRSWVTDAFTIWLD